MREINEVNETKNTTPDKENMAAEQTQPERARTGYERVAWAGRYYILQAPSIRPSDCAETKSLYGDSCFESGNYINDERLAKNRAREARLFCKLVQWQALHDDPVDWGDNEKPKFEIRFDYQENRLAIVADYVYRVANTVYFSSYKSAREAIKTFRDELMWYYTAFFSRLDEKRAGAAK